MTILFYNGLGLSLGAKLASTNERSSFFNNIFRLFPNGEKNDCAACCTIRLEVLRIRSVDFFYQKTPKT